MKRKTDLELKRSLPVWAAMPTPAKALATATILIFAVAMGGALGQIIVHDIIPTFYSSSQESSHTGGHHDGSQDKEMMHVKSEGRGDLFGNATVDEAKTTPPPFYQTEQFVWTLKWTHIHLFGMNMIFIFMGVIVLFLDLPSRTRTTLIVLPFFGVLIDIAAVWLKGYFSPAFFWLHLPGGLLFGAIYVFVSLKALKEMWFTNYP